MTGGIGWEHMGRQVQASVWGDGKVGLLLFLSLKLSLTLAWTLCKCPLVKART
jgi:hypothetical protein